MNRITKIFSVIIIAVCTLSFAACAGGNLPDNTAVITQNSTPSPTSHPTEAPTINAILPDSKAFNDVPIGAQKWIDKAQNSSAVLMSQAEIQAMNKQIRNQCSSLVDIENCDMSMTAAEIASLIEASSGPSLPKYDETGKAISQAVFNEIKNNRNIGALFGIVELKRAVTVQRTDIRALPTATEFYNNSSKQDHDRMQESELPAASAVLILHESLDGKFYFIQSYYYTGWVDAANLAIVTEDTLKDWITFAKLLNLSENATADLHFVVITDPQLDINGIKLDMGTAIPLADSQKQSGGDVYRVVLPNANTNRELTCLEFDIPSKSAHVGYADYTLRNFCIQAFKYLGMPYGWGGMHGNVDCSSYVLSVFKTFGFVFPRNTSQQNKVVGNAVNVAGKTLSEKESILAGKEVPTVIYISGHAMIYLGKIDDAHYIIHAPGGGHVCETKYTGLDSVISICQVLSAMP